jgi:transposase
VDWAPQKKIRRLPATYTRPYGTMYFFGAYDVNRDQLWGLPYEHQTQGEVLDFLMQLRQRYPDDQRLYVVLDNRSAHTTPAILEWVRHHKMSLVLTPTYSSFLNRIECQFTALKTFALGGTYPANHAAQFAAIFRYILYRNQQTVKPTARPRDIRVNLC